VKSSTNPPAPPKLIPPKRKRRDSTIDRMPKKLGQYRLCFELASGGMANVYLARMMRDRSFKKLVALKCIHPHLASDENFVNMFLDEAGLVSRINHPNVCGISDFGHKDNHYYIAMEYLAGQTLGRLSKRLYQRETVDPIMLAGFAARLFADACEGLHAAHELRNEKGEPLHVVHRDISPSNLFVCYDGSIRVMDFGIAQAGGRIQKTAAGQIKGKMAYMAPERLGLIEGEVDHRADIYALGIVLWELLAGKRLFKRRDDSETLSALIKRQVPAPSSLHKGIPKEMDEIALKALAPKPEDRYETAREMARALGRFSATRSEPVMVSDVAELMNSLFPEERARERQIADVALQASAIPALHATTRGSDAGLSELPPKKPEGAAFEILHPQGGALRKVPPWAWAAGGIALAALVFGLGYGLAPSGSGAPIATNERPPDDDPTSDQAGDPTDQEGLPVIEDASLELAPPDESAVDAAAATPPEDEPEQTAPDSDPPDDTANDPSTMTMRPRPPRGPPGSATIISPAGWADVYLGSRNLGRTPVRVQLPAGRHTLRVRPFGMDPSRRVPVTVRSGENARVVVRARR